MKKKSPKKQKAAKASPTGVARVRTVIPGVDPKTIAARAIDLARKCHEARNDPDLREYGVDPGDAKVYITTDSYGRDFNAGTVLDILEALGLDVRSARKTYE